MKVTKRQLRRIIREALTDWRPEEHLSGLEGEDFFSDREANPHDDSMYGDPEGGYAIQALAAAEEMGYNINQHPSLDSNNIAIDDALAAYPGEFTYEDIIAGVKAAGGVT